ncbi:MAG: MBL fold metallo-hydrolase [Acidobacteria bacterium]|nr:MBL fold metallo-hydrolase [Acidobacteriota bacterium]
MVQGRRCTTGFSPVLYLLTLPLLVAASLPGQDSPATTRLKQRNRQFEPEVIRVADNVYAAVREEFARITNKPVKAIIYTHSHQDHTGGVTAFLDPGAEVPIWARANFGSEAATVRAAGIRGGVRPVNTQGFDVPLEKRLGIGIAIPPNMSGCRTGGWSSPVTTSISRGPIRIRCAARHVAMSACGPAASTRWCGKSRSISWAATLGRF